MKPPPSNWSASPSMGTVFARLMELYARALRVEAAQRARRLAHMSQLVGELKR